MGNKNGISVRSPWKEERAGSYDRALFGEGTLFNFDVVATDLKWNHGSEQEAGPAMPSRTGSDAKQDSEAKQDTEASSDTDTKQSHGAPSRIEGPAEPVPPALSSLAPVSRVSNIKMTIMVVDDELMNRMVLLAKLRQCEAKVRDQLGKTGSGLTQYRFSMEIVLAEHAEAALSMLHGMLEARQTQTEGGQTEGQAPARAASDCDGAAKNVDIIILDEHMQVCCCSVSLFLQCY